MRRCCWFVTLVVCACGDNLHEDLTVTFESGPEPLTREVTAEIRFHAEGASHFTCALDSAATEECTSPFRVTTTDGSHVLAVTAQGGGRSSAPAEYAWRVDTIAPDTAISTSPPALSSSTSATFGLAAVPSSDVAGFECRVDGAAFAACTSPVTVTVTDGARVFEVRALDAVGNVD